MFATLGSAPASEVFPTNSVWRLRKGLTEASSPANAWRLRGFNDVTAGFYDALAPFWYGDPHTGGTQLTDMRNGYTCIFLRKAFTIGNPSEVGSMRLRAFVDDGFVAWINGVEVARRNVNVATTEPTYLTTATNAPEPVAFMTYDLPPPSTYLVAGTNVIAVQAFNTRSGSSDFGFDALLDLTVTETTPPVIAQVIPPPGTLNEFTSVSITFSEPVVGVTVDDLLINGVPVSTVSVNGNTYTFYFQEPFYGPVHITWINDHGITDLATPPNRFNETAPGATWQYNLVDAVPPSVANLFPPAGLTVRSLSQLEVMFSEPVLGVNASDLLINGQPATNVAYTAEGIYEFAFRQPATGLVQVAWAPGHGITDAASVPNTFAGGSWSYVLDPNHPLADLVLNEFLAANISTNGLADEDGEQQDWIEIYNRGLEPVDLENWSLSDDAGLTGLWTFPKRTLAAKSYLVVFASGKDRRSTNSASPLHTNFKLGSPGEHLGLYTPDAPRVLLDGFTPFPEQRNDISFGRDPTNALRYFTTPTPGTANGFSTVVGVCAPVHPNASRGHFARPFDLVLSCPTPGAEYRYTIDGSDPTLLSPLFPERLRVDKTTLFRAAAFKTNHLPSRPVTHSYFLNLPATLQAMPVLSIVTASNNLYGPTGILGIQGGTYVNGVWQPVAPEDFHNPSKHGLAWERATSVEWIRPDNNSGFQIDCGIRVQGSDYHRPRLTPTSKFSFRLYFRSDYGPGRLDYPLFPIGHVNRFDQLVLRSGFNEQANPFIRDEIHRRLAHDMGNISALGNVAVVLINGVPYASSPWYNPTERIHEEFFQEHLGGSPEWDVVGPPYSQSAGLRGVIDGDRVDFQNLVSYINSQPATSAVVYSNIARRLDLTNFVDYCMLNSYGAVGDWPGNNWRAGRDRSGGPWHFAVWDAEWGMGLYNRSITLNTFTMSGTGAGDSGLATATAEIAQIFNRLRVSPEFRLLWADRVQKHFFHGGALTGLNISNRFNELRSDLLPLMPSMNTAILVWARDRQPIYFSQMEPLGLIASSNVPALSQFGGRVPAGYSLKITNLSGTIYYTTNGSDPRTAFSGAISPSAIAYSSPLTLNQSVTIRARTLAANGWSALTEASFTVGSLGIPLRITEIMYNPPGGSLHEFLELQNTGATDLDLTGMYFDGITFEFRMGATLAGGARLVLGANTDTNAWKAQYPGVTPHGWFSGNLNNGGERITLYDRYGKVITFVEYKDSAGWPAAADGAGRSLELIDPNGNPNEPANWQASAANHGTPGNLNSAPPARTIELNEVMAHNVSAVNHAGTFPDYLELRNTGSNTVNLAGWSLTDDGNPRKFVFPPTVVSGYGHLVVWCDAVTNTTPGLHTGFSLAREGETVSLYDPATNRIDALTYGLQLTNYPVGRVDGLWTLTLPSTNAPNVAAALASPSSLILNEWLANPLPGEPDWLELFNYSAQPVSLQGLYFSLSNQVFQLNSLSFIPGLGYLQLFADEAVGPDHLGIKLPAAGGQITLSDPTGNTLQSVTYAAQAEGVSQGRWPDGGAAWASFVGSASPGAPNYLRSWMGPRIWEVLARNKSVSVGGEVVDFVEIFNPGSADFDFSGMSLSVNAQQPGQWLFPAGTVLASNSFLVIRCDGSKPTSSVPGQFNTGESLQGESGGVYLFNPNGQAVNSVEYGPQVEDLPIGFVSGWRLLSAATPGQTNAPAAVLGSNTALRINEWMANPESGSDWFEVHNLTNRPVSLTGISLSDDPSIAGQGKFFPAPLSYIGPRGFVKWVADGDVGAGRHHVSFALNQAGESLLMYATNGTTYTFLDGVGFGQAARGVSSGSLPDGAPNLVSFPGSATPGESNYRLLQNVVINEALTHTDPPLEDAIELYNPTDSAVAIGGWFLSNSRVDRRKFQIPSGTTIEPGQYQVFYEYQFSDGSTNAFALNSAHGDEIWLSAAAGGVETGERTAVSFGAALNGVSFGRVVTSVTVDFVPLTQRSFGIDNPATLANFRTGSGLVNAAPAIGPVIINEFLYHPPGGTNGSQEFLELLNNTGATVTLYDPAFPTNRWKLGGGISYTFPPGQSLPAGGFLLVVDFDPANSALLESFRTLYGVAAAVPVYGPFSGKLANDTDTIALYQPDRPQQPTSPDAGFVPYVLVDRVVYSDASPWPVGNADGGGASLQRLAASLYGNEPLHWATALPSPWTP
jgi:hypothetical protein